MEDCETLTYLIELRIGINQVGIILICYAHFEIWWGKNMNSFGIRVQAPSKHKHGVQTPRGTVSEGHIADLLL